MPAIESFPDGLRDAQRWQQSIGLPAWFVSLGAHFIALTALGLVVQTAPQGAMEAPTRMGGIVLVARNYHSAEYFTDEIEGESTAAAFGSPANAHVPLPDAFPQPIAPGPQLPSASEHISGRPMASDSAPQASPFTASGGPVGLPGHRHDRAVETQVFGVRGRGTRFVYVFDRPSSMEGGPLIAAKRELIASLQSLQSVHQFQIIFYNHEPQLMPLRGPSMGMAFGDDPGKRVAAAFVGSIFADGATDHMQALKMALRLKPDVIFFLTDADEPQLGTDDFQKIRQWNQGTSINAIEFGIGPPSSRINFLQRLAAENGGQHSYVDITRLVR